MSKLKNKKYIILTGIILVTMLLVLVMKYGTTDKYKGLVKVKNIKVSEKILSSSGTIESENTSKGIDEVEYKVKYTLDEIDGVTKRDVIIKGRTNSNYARFKGINKNNITSTLKENGKEIEVRIEDVPLGVEQELKLTLIIANAPNDTRIKPGIEISEATGEYTSILTTGIEVETNSLEGLVLDENNIRVGNIELSLKKDGREVKRTYTDEDGKYTFTDIEEGRYNVEVEEEIYESVSSEIEISESTVLNISVRKIEPYRIETHKYIERLNLVVNGETKEYTYNDKEEVIETVKNAKTISGEIEYKIVVKNTGEKSGTITKIEDEPGEGLKFKEEGNTGWEEKNKKIYYRPIEGSTLDANKTKEIKLVLEIENTEEIKTYINKLTTNGEIYEKVVYVLDGEIYKEEEVLEGELITPPSVPIENFDGWYTDINKTNKYKFSNPVRKDLILYGYTIEDIKYNVRYMDKGELYSSEEVKKNEYATKPSTDPSKEGYTFKYWSLDGENEYIFSTPVTEDIDLYSVYEINKYNVTFIDNNEEYNKQEISYNGNIIRPEDPSKEYYRFLYWSLEENGNPYDLNTPVTSNVTLYSVYEINRYRVKFIDQGNEISNELVDAGTLIQPIEVSKEGYTFKYWSEDNEHGYNFSTPVTKDVTLTSIYEINIYNVEFYHNDSLVKTLQVEYNNLIDQAEVPVVTKEGYTFTYWSLQNESEGYDFTTRVTKNIKLYSNFVKQRKAVIFNDENRITEVTVDWGDTVNPITDKGKTGYTFSHWSLNIGGEAFNFSTPIVEPTTLYAVYKINTYTITYNLDGGEVTENPSTYTVETEDFTLNNPSKVGYNFIGWTGSNGNIPSTNVTVEKGTINDLTYTANYEVIEYTITYTLNGGTVTENPSTYTIETDTFTLNNPSKTGYTFTGWTGSNGETPEETVPIEKGSTGNRNYEAHYNINKYTVIYMDEGLEYSREEVNYHDTATKPSVDPSKDGYGFIHWSLEENGSAYNFNTEIENNITLYSVYEINKYEVTFMDGENQYLKVSNIEHGSKVSEPSSHPDKNHNIFLGWTLNNEAYDFNTPVTSDITLYSKYEEVEKPTISHTPTEWTNNSVTVTITSDHNDYTYMYKINGGTYQSYTSPFEVSENCDITAYSVKSNVNSVEEEHEIDNIDKIAPLINYYEGEEITPTSIKIKIKIQDNESGIKLYKVYLDNTLLFTSNEYITNLNEEKTEEYTIGSLEQITTYNVKVEIEDKVGNTSEETKQITTTAKHYVARITRINNVELGENYLDFETLKEAIEYEECEINECKIEMLDDVVESNSILGGQEIELDLKGKTITGTTGKTFINNGTFKVIDSSVEIEDGSEVTPGTGKIINTTNTAIENNDTLIIGDLESPLLVSRTTPYIEGEIYGIDNNDTLNFYDGKIIGGTLAIRGEVTETPYSYNASVESEGTKSVATLEQIADAEARIQSQYYTLVQGAVDDSRNGTYEETSYNDLDFIKQIKSEKAYHFVYDESSDSIINDNQGIPNSVASSYIKIDLSHSEHNKMVTVEASISSESNGDIGYITATNSTSTPSYDSSNGRFVYISGTTSGIYKKYLEKGRVYYLHIGYRKDGGTDTGEDTFHVSDIKLVDIELSELSYQYLVPNGSYSFVLQNNGYIINNNQYHNNSVAHSYLVLDLTNESEDRTYNFRAEVSSEGGYDYGYITVNNSPNDPGFSQESGRYVFISGSQSGTYSITLTAGQVNYIHFGYRKDGGSASGTDTFTVWPIEEDEIDETSETNNSDYIDRTPHINEDPDTVVLLKNITMTSPLNIVETRDVILDLNGYTLTSSADNYIITNSGNLQITDNKYINAPKAAQEKYAAEMAQYNIDIIDYEEYINSSTYLVDNNYSYLFDYTGEEQEITVPYTGKYKLEVWGAKGGYRSDSSYGGNGGYSSGEIELQAGKTIYVYVGGSGNTGGSSGGFNGGGSKPDYPGGGGATDIRINGNTLYNRIIVAGGGGSDGASNRPGKVGGGASGGSASESYGSGGDGASQTSAGNYRGSFGQGGSGDHSNGGYGGAGGGGWYGGGGANPDGGADDDRGGGGGSGFAYDGTNTVPSGYDVGSYVLTNTSLVNGGSSMPTYDGSSTMTGNTGNGYAKITVIDQDIIDIINEEYSQEREYNVKVEPIEPELETDFELTGNITSSTNSVIYNKYGAYLDINTGIINLNKSGEYSIVNNEGTLLLEKNGTLNANQNNNIAIRNADKGDLLAAEGTINLRGDSDKGIYNLGEEDKIFGFNINSSNSNNVNIYISGNSDLEISNITTTGTGTDIYLNNDHELLVKNSNLGSNQNTYNTNTSTVVADVTFRDSNTNGRFSNVYETKRNLLIDHCNSTSSNQIISNTSYYSAHFQGTVTINDSTLKASNRAMIEIHGGDTVINRSTLECTNSGYCITAYSALTFNDSEIHSTRQTIENGTTMNINNTDITNNDSSDSAINNRSTLNIDGGSLSNLASGATGIVNEGTLNIKNDFSMNDRFSIGIQNKSGTLTIGENDSTVSYTEPYIKGSTHGVYKSGGTVNYYDGIVSGSLNNSYLGTINDIPTNYDIFVVRDTSYEDTHLKSIPDRIQDGNYVAQIGNNKFVTLQLAVDSITNDTPITIELLSNIDTVNSVEIPQNRDITLDFKDKFIKILKTGYYLTNNSELSLTNSLTGTNSNFIPYSEGIILNNAGAVLNYDVIKSDLKNNSVFVSNSGTFNMQGGNIESIVSSGRPSEYSVKNYGDMYMTGGTIKSTSGSSCSRQTEGCQNFNLIYNVGSNSYFEMTGGTLNKNHREALVVNEGTAKIKGGTIDNDLQYGWDHTWFIYSIQNSGTLEVTGGTYPSSSYGHIKNSGTALVKDVTFNNTLYPAFENTGNGQLTIDNVICNPGEYLLAMNGNGTTTINSGTYNGQILTLSSDGTNPKLIINDGTFSSWNTLFYLNESRTNPTITINDGSFVTTNNSQFGIRNYYPATINIYGGSYTTTSSSSTNYGIYNTGAATITIGTLGTPVDKNIPLIVGNTYGLYNSNNSATINFYDGRIGGNEAIYGTINNIEPGYEIVSENVDGKQYKYLDYTPVVEILDLNGDRTALQCGTTEEELCYDFQDAIDKAGQGYTLRLLREYTNLSTSSILTVASNQNIIIDLAGYNMNINNSELFENDGTLKIMDSSQDSTSRVEIKSGLFIKNNGDFELNGGYIESSVSSGMPSAYLVKNYGNMLMSGGTLRSYSGSSCSRQTEGCQNFNLIYNVGSNSYFEMTGGTLNKNHREALVVNEGTAKIKGGTIDNDLQYGWDHTWYIYSIQNSGTLEITGGSYPSSDYGHVKNSGTALIKDVTFNTTRYPVFENTGNGQMTIDNVTCNPGEYLLAMNGNGTTTINSGTYNGQILTLSSDGTNPKLIINDGTFSSWNTLFYLNESRTNPTITINDGSFVTTNNSQFGIRNYYPATINIYGGSYTTTSSSSTNYGIYNTGAATITIGTLGTPVDKNIPLIVGNTYGLYNSNNSATINFYDGRIGGNEAIYGTINNIEPGYEIVSENVDGKQYKYLDYTPVVEILDLNGDRTALQCGTTEEELCYDFQDAIDKAGQGYTLRLLREYTNLSTSSILTVASNQNIIIDLAGYNMNINNSELFENDGTLKIMDSSQDSTSRVEIKSGLFIKNNGDFELNGGYIESSVSSGMPSAYLVKNYGNMLMSGGTLRSYSGSSCSRQTEGCQNFNLIYNVGSNSYFEMTGGTLNKNHREALVVNEGTAKIKGGTIDNDLQYGWDHTWYIYSIQNSGTLEITGGSYPSSDYGHVKNSGTALIKDVTFYNESYPTIENTGNGQMTIENVTNTTISTLLLANDNSSVTINGGSYSGRITVSESNSNGSPSITVNNGNFNSSYSIFDLNNTHSVTVTPTLTISGGTFNSSSSIISNSLNSTINIYNGTLTSSSNVINSSNGNVNVYDGTITSSAASGINLSGGSLTIGTKGGVPDQTTPSITGKTYGLYNSNNNDRVNFYDGIITGETNSVFGIIYEVEPGYREDRRDNGDGTHSDVLIVVGETERVAVVNGVNFMSLQAAVNYAVASNTPNIVLYKSVTLDSDLVKPTGIEVYVITGSNTVTTGSYTVDSGIHIVVDPPQVGSSLYRFLSSIMGTDIGENNIIVYQMEDGSKLESNKTYKVYKLVDNEYKIINFSEEELGEYTIGNEIDTLRTVKGRIMLNSLSTGQYKVVGSDNKELDFEIYEDGISHNIRRNTGTSAKVITSVVATLILQLRTGYNRISFMLLTFILLILIMLLFAVKKRKKLQ